MIHAVGELVSYVVKQQYGFWLNRHGLEVVNGKTVRKKRKPGTSCHHIKKNILSLSRRRGRR